MTNKLIDLNLSDLQQVIYRKVSLAEQQEMIARRNELVKHNVKAPKYLLESEIKQFFKYVDNSNDLILLKTMWVTGCRVSEALMLTPNNFNFGIDSCFLTIPNLKQKIRVKKDVYSNVGTRYISLTTKNTKNEYIANYLDEIKRYIVTNKIQDHKPLFKHLRQNVNRLIGKAQDKALANGVRFPFKISAKTFRHSLAMHLYFNGCDEKFIQEYLGHSRLESTREYTKLFHLEYDINNIQF